MFEVAGADLDVLVELVVKDGRVLQLAQPC